MLHGAPRAPLCPEGSSWCLGADWKSTCLPLHAVSGEIVVSPEKVRVASLPYKRTEFFHYCDAPFPAAPQKGTLTPW
jgi:hypothetical protein